MSTDLVSLSSSDSFDDSKEKFALSEAKINDDKNKKLRNFSIAAHVDAGKTTTTERVLFYTGVNYKIGEVHEGEATMDFMAQEKERGITINAAATTCYWTDRNNEKYRLNLIDTPGHIDFTNEVNRAFRVIDGSIIVFDAVQGVEAQTKTVWAQATRHKVPRFCFINKMDRSGANFYRTVSMIQTHLEATPIVVQLPVGEGEHFSGVIDLIRQVYIHWPTEQIGAPYEILDIPAHMVAEVEKFRAILVEKALEFDELLFEKYLESNYQPTQQELVACLRKATLALKAFPVICGTAFKNKGVQLVLDSVVDFLPSPSDLLPAAGSTLLGEPATRIQNDDASFSGLVFKITVDPYGILAYVRVYSGRIQSGDTVLLSSTGAKIKIGRIVCIMANKRINVDSAEAGDIIGLLGLDLRTGQTLCDIKNPILLESITPTEPVLTMAVECTDRADQDKMITGLMRLSREDPAFVVATNPETGQITISGSGELHLEIMVDRLLRESKVKVLVGAPQVSYREFFTESYTVDYKHQKQTGGAGQFAVVKILFEPMVSASTEPVYTQEFEFISKMRGQNIDSSYIPSIKEGIDKARKKGVMAGYLLGGFRATLLDGAQHAVDSSTQAFETAGEYAFREAMKHTTVRLLEPIMNLTVNCNIDQAGSVMGDINKRRGQIKNQETERLSATIFAHVPLQELFNYVSDLRALTSGQASAGMEFSHYAPAPTLIAQAIIAARVS